MTKIKFVFFGTPEFAKIILEKLINANFIPTAVVTNPDRPVGRKKILTAPQVKKYIEISKFRNIEVLQPENLKSPASTRLSQNEAGIIPHLKSLNIDVGILAAYGKIIPQEIIDIFPKGIIVVHPSLLPKYRGATPIQSAILADEKETGTTLILIDEKVDHGPILAKDKININDDDDYGQLSKKLAELSGDLLVQTLPKYLSGEIVPKKQKHTQATYTKKFTSGDGFVDEMSLRAAESGAAISPVELSSISAEVIFNKIRALNPEPGVWTILRSDSGQVKKGAPSAKATEVERRMKLLAADLVNGKLVLRKIQYEGERPKALNAKQHE